MEPLPPGYRDAINYKTYQNDLYCAAINDGRTVMPPEDYIKYDHRLTIKDQGKYQCAVDNDGRHGDTFDSGKQAEFALASGSAGAFSSETLAAMRTSQPVAPRLAGHIRPVHQSRRLNMV